MSGSERENRQENDKHQKNNVEGMEKLVTLPFDYIASGLTVDVSKCQIGKSI